MSATVLVRYRMLYCLCIFRPPQTSPIKQVLPRFSVFRCKLRFSTTAIQVPPISHSDFSSINLSCIAKSVFLKYPHLWENKSGNFSKYPFKDLIFELSSISPQTIRKFRRVPELKSEDVLQILVGFESEFEKSGIQVKKVKSLWGLFNYATEKTRAFEHFPKSYELMANMLVRVGMFRETEYLLSTVDSKGIKLASDEIFSNLIEGYAKEGEPEKAISIYDRIRARGLVPSVLCYCVMVDFLIEKSDTQLALRTYMDMVETGLGSSEAESGVLENVVRLLCRDAKFQEARDLVKKVIAFGIKPSNLVLDEISSGYCEKKDYDDLLKLFAETRCDLNVSVGNKVIYSLCRNFGLERASTFLQEMENIGFSPDKRTYGILISWCCRERKLKKAFIYLSEMFSRSLNPHVCSYNALISGVFKEDMWKHARDFLCEMDDRGVTPNFETYEVLLAGYSKARRFDEVKAVIGEMAERGLLNVSALEDPLSKAFMLLGLDPLAVKLRRDNDVGLFKTEFFDHLGNGLYLETDITKFEKVVNGVLEDALFPDFNSFILRTCAQGAFKDAVTMIDETVKWGQELSFSAFSGLVKGLCTLRFSMKTVVSLNERNPNFTNQLDQETLNLLVQALSKKGLIEKAMAVFEDMSKRNLDVYSQTYDTLITSLCRERNLNGFLKCLELAGVGKWSPKPNHCKAVFGYLCQGGFLKEALQLLENALVANPSQRLHFCHDFLEVLCSTGSTTTAHALVEELQNRGLVLDHISYSYLVKGFFKEKMRSKAFLVLELMLARNLVPTLDVKFLSISQLCRDNEFEKAICLKDIALQEQSLSSNYIRSALIGVFCTSGMVEVAVKLFRDMLSNGSNPHSEACNVLIRGFCRMCNLRKLRELMSFMIRRNMPVSVLSYRDMVLLMCTSGKVPLALSAKELLLKAGNLRPIIIYNILIFHLFRTKNGSFVEGLLDELLEKGLQFDAVTYNYLIHGYCRCGEVAQSVKHLTAMLSSTGYRPRNRSIRAVMTCLCSHGDTGLALDLSREIELKGWVHDSVTQNAIVEGLLGQKRLQEAIAFLGRMVEKDLIPDNVNYDNLIKQLCRFGREDEAINLLNVMLKKGSIPSSSTYDGLIQCSCKCHKLDQALDLIFEMLDMNLNPSMKTWDVIVCGVCQSGRTPEGERLLNLMIQIGEKPTKEIYRSLIDRCHSEGNLSKASEYLQKMQQNGHEPDFGMHWSLISNLKNKSKECSSKAGGSFLSRLLSDSGFAPRKDFKAKTWSWGLVINCRSGW